MDRTNGSTPPHSLEATSVIPISHLCPDLRDPSTKAVGGVVTITWPYNAVENTLSFYLAEPDFRLRRQKGQVRIDFTGRVAKAAREFGLGSNDDVLIGLDGVAWEAEVANRRQSLPDAGLGWRLVFSNSLYLRVKRAQSGKIDIFVVNEQSKIDNETPPDPTPIQSLEMTKSPSTPLPISRVQIGFSVGDRHDKELNDGEFASPAFVKRARLSYGSLFEGGFDIFEEDGGIKGMGRKRARFGWNSSGWRYTSRSPSPELAAASPKSVDEHSNSPTRAASPSTRVEMVDEGCQVMELDQPSPRLTGTLDVQADAMLPKAAPINLSPANEPTSSMEQPTQTAHLNNQFSESTIQVLSAPTSGDVQATHMDAPSSPGQKPGPPEYSPMDKPWDTNLAPPTVASQPQTPTSHSHVDVPFSSSGFENITSNTQSQFNEVDSSLKPHRGGDEEQMPLGSDVAHVPFNLPVADYPPFDVAENIQPNSTHDEALTNYPASYLDDTHTSQPSHLMEERVPEYLGAAGFGPAAWVTINHSSQGAAMTPTDRLSTDENTPEQALTTHETGSASESNLESMAVGDTVIDDHTHAPGMYEDMETDDEADAQYSEDDELGYDEEEIGGDYDARNYEEPDDDDDDSHDEDLRPRPLEPEFGDEGSWDESEEGEEGEFDEEDYESETSNEGIGPPPQPAAPTIPTVIDLISSSEDENENESEGDEDEDDATADIQPSSAGITSRVLPSHQEPAPPPHPPHGHLDGEEFEMISQPPAPQIDNSSAVDRRVHEYTSSHGEEEEGEDEDDMDGEMEEDMEGNMDDEMEDEDEVEYDDEDEDEDEYEDECEEGEEDQEVIEDINESIEEREATYMQHHPNNEPRQQAGPQVESDFNAKHDDNVAPDVNREQEDISSQTRPRTELPETIDTVATSGIREDVSANVRSSAADGLDILSRRLDDEPKVNHRASVTPVAEEEAVGKLREKQPLTQPLKEDDSQTRDSSNYQDTTISEARLSEVFPLQSDGQRQGSPITKPKADAADQPLAINHKESAVAAPSSPPLTQSFRSQLEEDATSTFEEAAVSPADQTDAAPLPTPLNSQIVDVTDVVLSESVELLPSTEPKDVNVGETLILENTVDNAVPQGIETGQQDGMEQRDDGTRTFSVQAEEPPDEPPATSPSAPPFETQVDAGLLAPSDIISPDKADRHPSQEICLNAGVSASDTRSFISHMEVDDELQASIQENYQFEEYPDDGQSNRDRDGNTEASSEAHVDLEPTDQMEDSFLLHADTPEKQIAEEASTQLERSSFEDGSVSMEGSGTLENPSVYLARLSIASRKAMTDGDAHSLEKPENRITEKISSQLKKLFDEGNLSAEESDTWVDNSSVYLARLSIASRKAKRDDRSSIAERASLSSQTSRPEEDNSSMAAAKLQLSRHLRDELFDCASLKILRQHLTKSLDVIAVAVMQPPEPRRAKGGPREFMMSFTISDHSIGPHAVAEVLIYRPYKDRLPVIKYGDIVLLRNFTVVSLADKGFGLRSNEESSWAVFDYEDEPAQIRGPPVEYGECETRYVGYLREWFRLLDAKARAKLERANQHIINARNSKA
ncbi:hypothetical protein F4861DRAFT_517160 [Xylaria intraflava]|nr:hypothetical protein F4861DRAFT_517160 [Xylaria intraflava]